MGSAADNGVRIGKPSREAAHAGLPLLSRTELANQESGLRAIVECPVKTLNINDQHDLYQVDTGPVAWPDPALGSARLADPIALAFVAFNCPTSADFIVESPTTIVEGGRETGKVHHYSRMLRSSTRSTAFIPSASLTLLPLLQTGQNFRKNSGQNFWNRHWAAWASGRICRHPALEHASRCLGGGQTRAGVSGRRRGRRRSGVIEEHRPAHHRRPQPQAQKAERRLAQDHARNRVPCGRGPRPLRQGSDRRGPAPTRSRSAVRWQCSNGCATCGSSTASAKRRCSAPPRMTGERILDDPAALIDQQRQGQLCSLMVVEVDGTACFPPT